MYGTIYTRPDEFRSITHRDGAAAEARPVPRHWGDEWLVSRCGSIDYKTGTITWSDGSVEFVKPFAG